MSRFARLKATLGMGTDDTTTLPFEKYKNNPVGYARDVVGLKLTEEQKEALLKVAKRWRLALRSGRKIGKSTLDAVLALWWVATRPGARVILVAPTYRQVRAILWREVRRLHRNAKQPIGGVLHEAPERGLQFADGREIVGMSSDSPEAFQGWSGESESVLYIVDEASGVPEEIFSAIIGNLAGGGALVLTGNPTKSSGTFFDVFHTKQDHWDTMAVSSLNSPNVIADKIVISGLATRKWCEQMAAEWGTTSPLYQVHVQGEFATQAENAIIGLGLVEEGRNRWPDLNRLGPYDKRQLGPLELGVDPARFGDDSSIIFARRGVFAYEPFEFRNLDSNQLAARVEGIVAELRHDEERPTVRVDVIGIGAGVYDRLRESRLLIAQAVNVSETAVNSNYQRKRDEVWFELRDWLKSGGAIPPDTKLDGELVAPTYTILPTGKIKVESKDEIKSRLKRSPDRADALALAVYNPRRGIAKYLAAVEAMTKSMNEGPHVTANEFLQRKFGGF